MDSDGVTYIRSFMKFRSGIRKLIGGAAQTHRQQSDLMSLILILFQVKASMLKKMGQQNVLRFCFSNGLESRKYGRRDLSR
jgi:hypothetical protein